MAKLIMDDQDKEELMYWGMWEDLETTLRQAREMHAKWNGAEDGRMTVWLGPQAVDTLIGAPVERFQSERGLRAVVSLADELKTGINIHFCEIKEQRDFIEQRYGCPSDRVHGACGHAGPQRAAGSHRLV